MRERGRLLSRGVVGVDAPPPALLQPGQQRPGVAEADAVLARVWEAHCDTRLGIRPLAEISPI